MHRKMKLCGFLWILLWFLGISSSVVTAAPNQTPIVTPLGTYSNYQITLEGRSGTLSRDGGYAMPVSEGTIVKKPGNYFLCITDSNGLVEIEQFAIKHQRESNYYTVGSRVELQEAIKSILENCKTEAQIQFTYGNFTLDQMDTMLYSVFEDVIYGYPDITYEWYEFNMELKAKPLVKININYPLANSKDFKAYSTKTDAKVIQILNSCLTPGMKDYEIEAAIGTYLIEDIVYSKNVKLPMVHTMQGALIDGVAVCDGYAQSMMYLLNSAGVPSKLVIGTADGEAHAWNSVKIQGDYYHVDLTWSDEDELGQMYHYFNETDAFMSKTHKWDRSAYPKATATTYSSIHRPIDDPQIYRVSTKLEWNMVKRNIGKDGLEEADIIFYNKSSNKWNSNALLEDIVSAENSGVEYYVHEKYDSLVISYKNDGR